MELRLRQITFEAEGINTYEMVDPQGRELPPFIAGSHIDVHLPGGLVRQYSLCNDPSERNRYCIGVLKDPKSTGGSRAMHENLRVGDAIKVSEPRCNFRLVEDARYHLLLAGGIGVTPMIAMIERLTSMGAEFAMHYCTRSERLTAFRDRLSALVSDGKVIHHYDGGDPSRGLDIATLLAEPKEGTHLYYCGPSGFMEAVKKASGHWPEGTVHFEYFKPTPSDKERFANSGEAQVEFHVQLGRDGETYLVPPGKTIVQVLRENSVEVETSCEAGTCGTCKTRYLDGEPEHYDYVLTNGERKEWVMICCARSRTRVLVLDLLPNRLKEHKLAVLDPT